MTRDVSKLTVGCGGVEGQGHMSSLWHWDEDSVANGDEMTNDSDIMA